MLEEPECGAPGARAAAAAMECRERPTFPGKKLIQARLPFKRLSLTPKDKSKDNRTPASTATPPGPLLPSIISLDDVENDCPLALLGTPAPKLLNGKGPLDHFLCHPRPASVIIDLTEDSTDPTDDPSAQGTQTEAAGPTTKAGSTGTDGSEAEAEAEAGASHPLEPSIVICSNSEGRVVATAPAIETRDHLGDGPQSCAEQDRDGWSKAGGGLLFKDKLPVVLLQDILSPKSPCVSPLGRDARTSDPESGLEEDSTLSDSPLSSTPTSSPEGPATTRTRPESPPALPACTPTRTTMPKKPHSSTEKARLKLQRDQERLGRQLKLQAEKEQKERLKEEARRAREAARRRREEERELKERERRERREKDERERAEKQRLKAERRKERQEALEARQEEKRKKEEEKRLREEEKRIKAEKAEITRFFQKPKTPQAPKTLAGSCGKFAPFEIKEHMVLAPQSRAALAPSLCEQLDRLLQLQASEVSFLDELRGRRPLCSGPTLNPHPSLFDSNVILEDSMEAARQRPRGRMKLLQFCENHRPAYWGSWTKRSALIRPRHPWAQDSNLLDYEVDSDEEWEEEEPGESLSHSEGDEDDDVGEDEDDDDGFFVPHGYLSEDEGVTEECADPEKNKVRQRLKAKEWDELLAKAKGVRVLQPVQVGCLWAGAPAGPELRLLQQFRACLLEPAPPEEDPASPKASKREKRDQLILARLLPLLHGNVHSSKLIIREFQECCRRGLLDREPAVPPEGRDAGPPSPRAPEAGEAAVPSKARLKRLISENSVYEKRPDFRMCWYVLPQVLRSFRQERLPVPCRWSYVTALPAPPAPRDDPAAPGSAAPGLPQAPKRKAAGSMCITQFMKKRRHDSQGGARDPDGFQADTEEEEDEEEDGDCAVEVPEPADTAVPHTPVPQAAAPAACAPRPS